MLSLFALLLLIPLADRGHTGAMILSLLSTFILVSVIGVVSDNPKNRLWAILLALPPLVLQWMNSTFDWGTDRILLVPSFYHLPIYVFIAFLMVRYLFKDTQLHLDHLYGAVSLYLLIGLFWSHLYYISESVIPGSFTLPEGALESPALKFAELLYFSYVTLTTLGYGDILPVSLQARSLAITEAVVGVLFIGALIGRIAGMAIFQRHDLEGED